MKNIYVQVFPWREKIIAVSNKADSRQGPHILFARNLVSGLLLERVAKADLRL